MQPPARIPKEVAATRLGFQPHDIPILVGANLLKPLGKRTKGNHRKYFAAVHVEQLLTDVNWLSKATDCVIEYWADFNARKNKVGDLEKIPSESQ